MLRPIYTPRFILTSTDKTAYSIGAADAPTGVLK